MRKNYIFTVTFGMFFVLSVLIAIQYYWSQKVFRLNHEYFNSCVNIAVSKTVNIINLGVSEYRHKVFSEHQNKTFRIIDSLGFSIYKIREKYPFVEDEYKNYWKDMYRKYIASDTSYSEDKATLDMFEESDLIYFKQRKKYENDSNKSEENIDDFIKFLEEKKAISNSPQQRVIISRYENLLRERNALIENNEKVRKLVKENTDNAIYDEWIESVSDGYIDSIFKNSLASLGIDIPLQWQIFRQDKKQAIHENSEEDLLKIKSGVYCYPMSAEQPYYLFVYFPNRDRFIISQIWMLVFASIVLIASQIMIFSYTAYSLGRQKKIADLRNDFINHVTHELKTPVSTISLICDAYSDSDIKQSKESIDEYFSIIKYENKRLESLISQIFDISKIEKGEYPILITKFSLKKVIKEVIQNMLLQVENKNGKIIIEFNNVKDDMIESDKTHISRIFSNLIDNANKYSKRKPLIKISMYEVAKGIMVDIADNGIGISKKDQEHIFKTLYRVSTNNIHDIKGFGLGLSYVKSMLKHLGGKISLDSEIGKGSCFHVFLPKNS